MRLILRMAIVLGVILSTFGSPWAANVDASATSDVAIVTTFNGSPYYDACFVLVGFSNEGCDENGDGQITFQDVPPGTYTVTQTRDLGAGRYVSDFTINVTGNTSGGWETFYATVSGGGSNGETQQTGPMVIGVHMDCANSTDCGFATFSVDILVTSQDGVFIDSCTVNGNTDDDSHTPGCSVVVPIGEIVVVSIDTDTMPAGFVPTESPIYKDTTLAGRQASHDVIFTTVRQGTSGQVANSNGNIANGEVIDIAFITRDPQDGELLTGACYVLIGYSNEGCDENGDGQVTFADIPEGTYTVRQTQTPAGYPAINDYEIHVAPMPVDGGGVPPAIPQGFVVRQAPEQNAPGTRHVSVVLVGSGTTEKFQGGVCAEIVGASNVGCDDDLSDGQIDFLDVPAGGPYELRFSNLPAGYKVTFDPNFAGVTIRGDATAPANTFVFVFVTSTEDVSTNPLSAASAPRSAGDLRDLDITAIACSTTDPDAIIAAMSARDDTCYWDIGATFHVTTANGEVLGSCTLEGSRDLGSLGYGGEHCSVLVPMNVPVLVTQDTGTISPGTAPEQTTVPHTFTSDPNMGPSFSVEVLFMNLPTVDS